MCVNPQLVKTTLFKYIKILKHRESGIIEISNKWNPLTKGLGFAALLFLKENGKTKDKIIKYGLRLISDSRYLMCAGLHPAIQ